MNEFLKWTGLGLVGLFVVVFVSACTIGNGQICGPQTPRAYCNKEAYERLINPKTYGEYFEKPGMTKESWRADWIACGGTSNGDYSSEVPSGSSTAVLLADSKRKAEQLSSCMQSKGYEYRRKP
jgi:hypothetical protein